MQLSANTSSNKAKRTQNEQTTLILVHTHGKNEIQTTPIIHTKKTAFFLQ